MMQDDDAEHAADDDGDECANDARSQQGRSNPHTSDKGGWKRSHGKDLYCLKQRTNTCFDRFINAAICKIS